MDEPLKNNGKTRTLLLNLGTPQYRECMTALSASPSIDFLGVSSVCQAGRRLALYQRAVCILCVGDPDHLYPELVEELIRETHSEVVLHLPSLDHAFTMAALRRGVKGLVTHFSPAQQIVAAVEGVGRGEVWVPRDILYHFAMELMRNGKLGMRPVMHNLTPREQEVVECLQTGLSNKEIARELSISPRTVKTHLQHIFKKSHVHNRLQLAARL